MYDEDWDNWQVGDVVTWADCPTDGPMVISDIRHGYVYWKEENGYYPCTRDTNLIRVADWTVLHEYQSF